MLVCVCICICAYDCTWFSPNPRPKKYLQDQFICHLFEFVFIFRLRLQVVKSHKMSFGPNCVFVTKIVNTRLTKIFMAIIAPDERLPSSATLRICKSKIRPLGPKKLWPFFFLGSMFVLKSGLRFSF